MKARVKATGERVEVEDCGSVFYQGALFHGYRDNNGNKYMPDELEILFDSDFHPDYWTRLEHQIETALLASEIAHALVEKLKEEERK